ncbi:MAG: hypothetical protein AAFQ37_01905 [Bacteroidota bacterium]
MGADASTKQIGFNLFVGLVLLVNAALTFGFGMRYGAQIIDTGNLGLSKLLGGFTLALFFDLAALGWYFARQLGNQTSNQIAVAKILATASIVASTLVSVIQVGLSTSLVDLSGIHTTIGVFGLALIMLITMAHFIGLFYYQSQSQQSKDTDDDLRQEAQLKQIRNQQRAQVQKAVIEKVNQKISEEVDAIAELEKNKILREFYADFNYTGPTTSSPTVTNVATLKELTAELVNQKLEVGDNIDDFFQEDVEPVDEELVSETSQVQSESEAAEIDEAFAHKEASTIDFSDIAPEYKQGRETGAWETAMHRKASPTPSHNGMKNKHYNTNGTIISLHEGNDEGRNDPQE